MPERIRTRLPLSAVIYGAQATWKAPGIRRVLDRSSLCGTYRPGRYLNQQIQKGRCPRSEERR